MFSSFLGQMISGQSSFCFQFLHMLILSCILRLMHMWQTMHNSHQVQNHISQQLNHLTDQQTVEPTTESQRQAAGQLQTEVTSWYHSFCKLVKYQREYVRTLCKWTELTNYIEGAHSRQSESSTVHALSEKWQLALDNLPDKVYINFTCNFHNPLLLCDSLDFHEELMHSCAADIIISCRWCPRPSSVYCRLFTPSFCSSNKNGTYEKDLRS